MSSKPNLNSFDLLRVLAATAVIVSHQFQLLGRLQPTVFGVTSLGFFGVLVFFGLSGGLITNSWERDPRVKPFLIKRCLRIFPALVVVVLATLFILGPAFTRLSLGEYFSSGMTWRYLTNAVLITRNSGLPGVFEANPYPSAINSSLWTLPVEFALYLSVLGAGVLGFLRRKYWVSGIVFLLAILATIAAYSQDQMTINRSQLLLMFWWGAWVRMNFLSARPPLRLDLALGLAAIVLLATVGPHSLARTGLILLASGLVWLAAKIPWGERLTRRTGDLSYGVYIIGFPVQQSLLARFGPEAFSCGEFLALALAITFPLALLSWWGVERRFIRLKNIFTAANPAPRPT